MLPGNVDWKRLALPPHEQDIIMHVPSNNPLDRMADTLAEYASVSADDRAALLELPYTTRTIEPGSYLVRDGAVADNSTLLLSGYAICQKTTGQGDRQIIAIKIPGDILALQNMYLDTADHNVQSLTRCNVVHVSNKVLGTLLDEHPSLRKAVIVNSLIESSMLREWMLNIGRRDSLTRIAHFLCEFAMRVGKSDKAANQGFQLPMTQEQFGDALGLTAVHINRTLKVLAKGGLIQRSGKNIRIMNWDRLRDVADFNSRYLHLDQ